jgi:hypothetical protein
MTQLRLNSNAATLPTMFASVKFPVNTAAMKWGALSCLTHDTSYATWRSQTLATPHVQTPL